MGFSAGPRGIQDACRSVNTRPDTGFSLSVNEKRTINGEGGRWFTGKHGVTPSPRVWVQST